MLIFTTLFTAIPVNATTVGPYNYNSSKIKSISVSTTKQLQNATYYKATVNSTWHGLEKNWHDLTTHLVIGSKNTKFFVYSADSNDKLSYSRRSVEELVRKFEEENPAYQVVAAVNGDFFNTSTGEPEEPMLQNGDMLKSFLLSDMTGRGVVGTDDKTGKAIYYTIGNEYARNGYGTKLTYTGIYQVQVLGAHKTNAIISYSSTIGKSPSTSMVSFTTPDYSKGGDYTGKTVYVVDLERYRNDTGSHNGNPRTETCFYVEGKIIKKISGTANMKPQKGQAYIAVNSSTQAPYIKVGAYVKCQKVLTGEWANVSNAIGFKQQLLAEGKVLFYNAYGRNHTSGDETETLKWTEDIYDYPHCWKARTAIGFKADGTCVMMVIPYNGKLGATYHEMSNQFKALGCTNAFLLDGGGSSTMVIRENGSLKTIVHAEGGSGSEGREIANIAILAVRKPGVALPVQDKVIQIDKETSKDTAKDTAKDTETEVEESSDTEAIDVENSDSILDEETDESYVESVEGDEDASVEENEDSVNEDEEVEEESDEEEEEEDEDEEDEDEDDDEKSNKKDKDEVETSGCGGAIALPATIVAGGLAVAGVKKKRKKDE